MEVRTKRLIGNTAGAIVMGAYCGTLCRDVADEYRRRTAIVAYVVKSEVILAPLTVPPYARGCSVTLRERDGGREVVLFSAKPSVVERCAMIAPGRSIAIARSRFAEDTVDVTLP